MEFEQKRDKASQLVISLSNLLRVRKWVYPVLRTLLRISPIRGITLALLSVNSEALSIERPYLIRGLMKALCTPERLQRSMLRSARRRYRANNSQGNFEVYILLLLETEEYFALLEVLSEPRAEPYLHSAIANYASRYAKFDTGDFRYVCKNSMEVTEEPYGTGWRHLAIINAEFLRASYAAGMTLEKPLALWYFAHQYQLAPDDNILNEQSIAQIEHQLLRQFTVNQGPALLHAALSGEKVGVFMLHAPQALGHAILDPYHYLALYRNRYDRIYFMGGDLGGYSNGTRACIEIVKQYGEYLPVSSDVMLNLSWMSMGQFQLGKIKITIEHYWSLLREVTHRTLDEGDAFSHNAWHFDLPQRAQNAGERFCRVHGIDLNKPIVTLHARDHGYHAIAKQGFRNSPINDYVPAIEHLLKEGYQVIRLGDEKMPRLRIHAPGFFEIPTMKHYENALDPFFIKQSAFMIGSQSGPCSYARSLGIPVLSINAVFSYTLLPSIRELACFKRYVQTDENGHERYLGYDEIMERNVFHMENSYQLETQGISVTNCTPEEITAAVKDMIDWVHTPDLPMTAEQQAFHRLTQQTAARIKDAPDNNPAIADYLGIALPGYRIAPTVETLRAEAAS